MRAAQRSWRIADEQSQGGLSAKEVAGALISMTARSKSFEQRPDTLLQDRHLQID
jgi:hypothetical protein